MLGDPMNPENKVVIKIKNKTFYFQGYTNQISFKNNDGTLNLSKDNRLVINLNKIVDQDLKEDFCLYAVPLNCELSNINIIELEKYGDGFSFPESIKETQFIVFDNNKDKDCKILPTYVTTSEDNIVNLLDPDILKERKKERIEAFAKSLFDQNTNEEEWQKLLQYVKICSDFQLPLSAFDNLRAACSNSDLTARLFFFLLYYSSNNEEFMKRCEKFEQELGFKFYWCSFDSFSSADRWVGETWPVDLILLIERAGTHVKTQHLNYNPNDWVFNGSINSEITNMRARLNHTVLTELPKRYPWLSEESKQIITITNDMPYRLKVMARSPITIGLCKLNLYNEQLPEGDKVHDLWHFENHEIRRNIIYCEELDKNWFDIAVKYTIKEILRNTIRI
jgi:hemerythrin superfamily protein